MNCRHCQGRGAAQYGDHRFVPTDRCRACDGAGTLPATVDIPEPTMTELPEPKTPMEARIHLFSGEECLSLTTDEAELLENLGHLEFENGIPGITKHFGAAAELLHNFRLFHTDVASLFREAAAHWFGDHGDCFNCAPQLVEAYGFRVRFLREFPEIEQGIRRRTDEFDRLVRARYADYASEAELFGAAYARRDHDHALCWDHACPYYMIQHLDLDGRYHVWMSRLPPRGPGS